MGRKTKKQKEVAKLRQEVEALRAELKKSQPEPERKFEKIPQSGPKRAEIDIRSDLKKTGLLTAVSLIILSLLALANPHWPWLTSRLPF